MALVGVVRRAVGRVSPRAALGGFALSEVAFRTLGALDGVTAAALVGIAYRQVPWVLLGNAAAAALYATAFYEFAPRLYARGGVERRRDLDALVAVVASAFGLLAGLIRAGDAVLAVGAFVVAGLPAATLAFAAFFRWRDGRLLDPEGTAVAAAERLYDDDVPPEIREANAAGGLSGRLLQVNRGVLLVFPLVFGSAMFGFLGFVLGTLYPVPELLVLAWVGYGAVAARTRLPVERRPSVGRVDLERRLYGAAESATRGKAGAARVALCLLGMVGGAVPMVVAVATLGAFAAALDGPLLETWVELGVLALLVVAGLYGVWYWLRALERVPAYLDRVDGVAEPRDPPPRVVGLCLPAAAALVAIAVAAQSFDATGTRVAFGVAWPAVVVANALAVRATRRADQPVASDGWALPVAATVAVLSTALLGFPAWVDTLAAGRPVVPGQVAAVLVGVLTLAALPPVERRLSGRLGGTGTEILFVCVGAVLVVVRGVVARPDVSQVFLWTGLFVGLSGAGGIAWDLYAGEDA